MIDEPIRMLRHDPDDARGCIACPLFHGVPRDGGCLALAGTHVCQDCGMVWRPANVPTVGVRFLPGHED